MKQFKDLTIKSPTIFETSSVYLQESYDKEGPESEAFFKSLVKTYTDNDLYPYINNCITKGKYEQL
jgi:hypothetical protein